MLRSNAAGFIHSFTHTDGHAKEFPASQLWSHFCGFCPTIIYRRPLQFSTKQFFRAFEHMLNKNARFCLKCARKLLFLLLNDSAEVTEEILLKCAPLAEILGSDNH